MLQEKELEEAIKTAEAWRIESRQGLMDHLTDAIHQNASNIATYQHEQSGSPVSREYIRFY